MLPKMYNIHFRRCLEGISLKIKLNLLKHLIFTETEIIITQSVDTILNSKVYNLEDGWKVFAQKCH